MQARHPYMCFILATSLISLALLFLSGCTGDVQDTDHNSLLNPSQTPPAINRWPAWSPNDSQIAARHS
jgi:hypothetical protein